MFNKITLYIVVNADFAKTNARIYTITTKKSQCEKYINTLLMLENKDHYASWCELRHLDVNKDSSWEKYKFNCLKEPKYRIMRTKHTAENVAIIFRMFNKCIPLGCGFETDIEYANIAMEICSDSELKEIADGLIKGME